MVLACAAFSALAALEYLSNAGEIRRGVHVGDVALGGKILGGAFDPRQPRPGGRGDPAHRTGGGDAAIPARRLGVRLDVGATVGRAYAVGCDGGIVGRVSERLRAPFGVGVPAEVRYRHGDAEAWMRGVAQRYAAGASDASVGISGTDVSVTPSRQGYSLDAPATLRGLDRSLESLRASARTAGEVERPAVTTREAEAAALAAREAVETPIRLTSRGESWSMPETAVVSSLEVVRRDGRPEVAVDRGVLQNHLARAYAPSSWSRSRPDTRSTARSSR